MSLAEPKRFIYGHENNQLYHNKWSSFIFDPWQNITIGTLRQQRIGDKIQPTGVKLKLWLSNKLDRPHLMYRLMALVVPHQIQGANVTTLNCFDITMDASSGMGNELLRQIEPGNGVKVLYDRVFQNKASVANKECAKFKKLYFKSKVKHIRYDGGAANTYNKWLVVGVVAYDSYGTLIADNVASYATIVSMYYRDF